MFIISIVYSMGFNFPKFYIAFKQLYYATKIKTHKVILTLQTIKIKLLKLTTLMALSCNYRQLSEEIALLKKMGADSTQEGNEELTAKLEIMQEYTKRLEEEINRLRVLLEQQQHHSLQPRPPSSISGSVSARDFIGSEENEIDLLVQQMVQAFPTGQEPGKWQEPLLPLVATPLLLNY